MAVAQWNNFTDYIVGNQVQNGSSTIYGCILANRNEPPPNVTYWNDLSPVPTGVSSLSSLTGAITQSCNIGVYTDVGQDNVLTITLPPSGVPYTLTGTTAGAVITNAPIGNTNPFPQNTFRVVSQVTFNLPPVLEATDSVYYDGYLFTDWAANFNSFWGVSYATNTFPTFTDILGSTTVPANALQFSNFNQIYLPLNIILPPTHLTSGGTVTLKIFCNPTSINHYLTATPITLARIGIVTD